MNSTVIEAVEGERVRIYVTNRLPVPTSVHWHGIYLPNGMDGAGGLTQPYIKSGETAKYEYTLHCYVASIIDDGHRHARGVVLVCESESENPDVFFPTCAPASSDRICFAP